MARRPADHIDTDMKTEIDIDRHDRQTSVNPNTTPKESRRKARNPGKKKGEPESPI